MRSAGLRQYSKSELLKVVEHATRKQVAAEQQTVRILRRGRKPLILTGAVSFVAGLLAGLAL